MLVVITSENLTTAKKKVSLEKLSSKIGDLASVYKVDMKSKVSSKIMAEGLNRLLSTG